MNRSTVHFLSRERERAIVSFLPQESDLIFILFHYFEFADRESRCGILISSAPGTGVIFSLLCTFTFFYVDRVSPPPPPPDSLSLSLSLAGIVTVDVKEMDMDLCRCRHQWLVSSWTYGKISYTILYCSRMWQRAFSNRFYYS